MPELKMVPRENSSYVPNPPLITPSEIDEKAFQEVFKENLDQAANYKHPFFSDKEKQTFFTILYSPLTLIFWLLAQPLRIFTYAVVTIRSRRYDPEKRVMPCCGFRGSSETNGKSCRVEYTPTAGPERGGIKHICFRCGCDKHISPLFTKADVWLPKEQVKVVKIEKAS